MYPFPPASSQSSRSLEDQHFEDLIQAGITAIKGGRLEQASLILNKALNIKTTDARPYIWLSATTQDPAEQRKYLECAVAADPSNATARRGLVILSQKQGPAQPSEPGPFVASPEAARPNEPLDASSHAFMCPKCGGRLAFDIQENGLACPYCGYFSAAPDETPANPYASTAADRAEQPLDYALPTQAAHRWATNQQRVACGQCGAVILLPPEQKADQCPYCGSNRIIASPADVDLMDPQVIGLMKVDALHVQQIFKQWLGKGLFAPDDLSRGARAVRLRPAYYPFWTFDGAIEMPWTCEVNVGTSRNPVWVSRNGTEAKFFDDVLVPGLKLIKPSEVMDIEPFKLKELVDFKPEYLAGWAALNYNLPMSDASLLGREKVVRNMRINAYSYIEPGRQKRNVNLGGGAWSGMTFKYVLLPLWVGIYEYRGQPFKVLINGQTGKIGGQKPRDRIKIGLGIFILVALVLMLALAISWWWDASGAAWWQSTGWPLLRQFLLGL